MDDTLVSAVNAAIEVAVHAAAGYTARARARETIRSYSGACRLFAAWCREHAIPSPVLPNHIAMYIASLADRGKSCSTIVRTLSAISQAHELSGLPSPTRDPMVRNVLKGIKRTLGTAPKNQKAPLVLPALGRVCAGIPDHLAGSRDRAIILLGFAGAFRRSELVSLDVEDLEFEERGIVVHLRRSKTDQEGEGRDVAIPYGSNPRTCPVRAIRAWLSDSGLSRGPLFRWVDQCDRMASRRLSAQSVARVVKRYADLAGIPEEDLGAHSLRSGLATSAAAAGKPERAIMNQTGHKSSTTLRKYIRRATIWDDCGATGIGL